MLVIHLEYQESLSLPKFLCGAGRKRNVKKNENLEASGENRRRGTMGNLFCFVFFFFQSSTHQICNHNSNNKVGKYKRTNSYEDKEEEPSANVVSLSNILRDMKKGYKMFVMSWNLCVRFDR